MDRAQLALALLGMGVKGVGDYFGNKQKMDDEDTKIAQQKWKDTEDAKPAEQRLLEWAGDDPNKRRDAFGMRAAGAGVDYVAKGNDVIKRDLPNAPSAGGGGGGGKVDPNKLYNRQGELAEKKKNGTITPAESAEFKNNNAIIRRGGVKPQ